MKDIKQTLKASAMAIPTMNKKNGITKSARLHPFHGACPIIGHSPPASSTKIINCHVRNYNINIKESETMERIR